MPALSSFSLSIERAPPYKKFPAYKFLQIFVILLACISYCILCFRCMLYITLEAFVCSGILK